MEGWGSLTVLIKKQEAAKNRKAKLKYELQKRKESLISKEKNSLVFKEVSKADLKTIKAEIREKYRKERIKTLIVNFMLLVVSSFVIYLIFKMIFIF